MTPRELHPVPIPLRLAIVVRLIAITTAAFLAIVAAGPPAAGAASRSAALKAPRPDSSGNLIVAGEVRARRGDVTVLYLASRCASTVRGARRGPTVIAEGRVARTGVERFRAEVAESELKRRSGRVCLMVADARSRPKVRVSRAYRVR